jgi:hypothetical protein
MVSKQMFTTNTKFIATTGLSAYQGEYLGFASYAETAIPGRVLIYNSVYEPERQDSKIKTV